MISTTAAAANARVAERPNIENFDVNDMSRAIDVGEGPGVPQIIMIYTEHYQCPAAGACGPQYTDFVAASRAAAEASCGGSLKVLDGDHDLYVTNLRDVANAINEVASSAARRR